VKRITSGHHWLSAGVSRADLARTPPATEAVQVAAVITPAIQRKLDDGIAVMDPSPGGGLAGTVPPYSTCIATSALGSIRRQ